MRISLSAVLTSLALVACTPAASPGAPASAPALTIAGAPELMQPLPAEEPLQWAASVTRVDFLEHQEDGAGVKLFGTAGGDPAMNGLYTHLAFFQSPAEGWRIFRVGDFLEYRVLSDAPGRVDLEIRESTLNEASGEIGDRTRYVLVTWSHGADGAAPDRIAVTPAQAGEHE